MTRAKKTVLFVIVALLCCGAVWVGYDALLDAQVRARTEKADAEMQELREALTEYNEGLRAGQAKDATGEARKTDSVQGYLRVRGPLPENGFPATD